MSTTIFYHPHSSTFIAFPWNIDVENGELTISRPWISTPETMASPLQPGENRHWLGVVPEPGKTQGKCRELFMKTTILMDLLKETTKK